MKRGLMMGNADDAAMPAETPAWESGGGYAPEKGMAAPLVAGALIQFVLCLSAKPDFASGGAQWLGYMLGAAAPAWLILYFAFGRRRDPDGWWKIPLVILPVTLVALSISALGSRSAHEDKALNSIAAVGQRLLDSNGRDAGSTTHSGATGEAGELERVVIELMRAISQRRQAFERDLEASGYPDALSPSVLRNPSDIPEARRRVAAGRAIIDRYYHDHASLLASVPSRFDAAEISDRSRDDAIRGFQESQRESNGYLERMRRLDLQQTDSALALLELLSRSSWRRRGENFEFARGGDADAFNSHRSRMDEISREQARLESEQGQRTRTSLREATTR